MKVWGCSQSFVCFSLSFNNGSKHFSAKSIASLTSKIFGEYP